MIMKLPKSRIDKQAKLKDKVLKKWAKSTDKLAVKMLIAWHGWEYLSETFIKSIKDFDGDDSNLKAMLKVK